MLKQRIITALILAPIAIACVFFLPPFEFSLFVGAVTALAAWEWANLAGYQGYARYVYAAAIVGLLTAVSCLSPLPVLVAGSLWWMASFVLVIRYPDTAETWSRGWIRALLGIFVLVPTWVGLLVLKSGSDSSYLIILLFFLVWGTDIGAYFAGRAFGVSKLAPRVSPGKSWAGFYGGLACGLIITVAMSVWMGKPDLASPGGIAFVAGCLFVVMVSVLGDLVVSMLKRERGIKDTSNLLPGHGGILDRIDSLSSASPVFALLILLYGWT
ncbi:MAG: phosphatidate cytidylyltransferase [Pseudomonadales bacterium]